MLRRRKQKRDNNTRGEMIAEGAEVAAESSGLIRTVGSGLWNGIKSVGRFVSRISDDVADFVSDIF